MLVLDTCEEVVFAEGGIQFVGDDGILGLGEVAEGVYITCYRPRGIVVLSVTHHKFDDRSGIVILGRTWLVLEDLKMSLSTSLHSVKLRKVSLLKVLLYGRLHILMTLKVLRFLVRFHSRRI